MFTPLLPRFFGRLLLGLLLFFTKVVAGAETNSEWLVRPWQTEDGLPDNSVEGVAQTADGYLWIGTPTGLARFDGLRFETCSLTNIIAFPNRGIITMLRGRQGALWLAMDRGAVVCLDGAASRAFSQDLPNLIPNGLAEAADGSLWIAYRGGAVYQIKDGKVAEFTSTQGLPEGSDICALTTDNQGRVWLAKAGQLGICRAGRFEAMADFEPEPMRLATARAGGVWLCCGDRLFKCETNGQCQDFGEFQPTSRGTIATAMLEDREGAVWVGTSFNGLFRHDQNGFETIPTSHQGILNLAEDREGNIWVGTFGSGLDQIRRRVIKLEGAESGLPFSSIESICEAADETIWAVTRNGVLVHKVTGRWSSIPVTDQWPGDATCVAADPHGAIWVGTRTHGLFCWRDGRFVNWCKDAMAAQLEGQTLHTVLVAKNGDVWMGLETPSAMMCLHDGQLRKIDLPADSRVIRAMTEDAAGTIWLGTSKGVLFRVNGDQLIQENLRPSQELSPIRCLYATPDGTVWIGYAGSGVGCLKNGFYAEFAAEQGLFDDYISHIVADGQGWLWLGANRGIFKVRLSDLASVAAGTMSRVRSVHYGRGEGLPSLQGTFGSSPDVLRSHDGRLWLPMQTALVVTDPKTIYESRDVPPALLTRAAVDDQVVGRYGGILPPAKIHSGDVLELASAGIKLNLPPGHRRVEFEFAALGFNAPENIQFRYRLLGFEEDWVEAGTRRTARYQRLASGDYVFEMIACNSDGDWSQASTRLNLFVAPFFWHTWWFRLSVLAAFTLSIVAIVRYVSFQRLHRQLRLLEQQAVLQRERARIAKDIHDDLGANLTQIAFLGELAQQDRSEPEKVAGRLGKISATARQAVKSLDEIVWAVNPRNDTLAHLLDYAGQFAVDYLRLAGVRCRLDFPEPIPARELSTDLRHNLFLAIKEALHNIVKHARATEIRLRVSCTENALEVIIADDGCGFNNVPDNALADGLRNMRQRLADIGGDCRIESQPGAGTKVCLRLPWPKCAAQK